MQAILGHRHVDTTLSYARLYDGTVEAHYYRAMGEVEERLGLVRSHRVPHRSLAVNYWRLWTHGVPGTFNGIRRKVSVMRRGS